MRQCCQTRAVLGKLDLRHLAGDPNLTLRLRATMLAEWRRDARKRLPELREMVDQRHKLMGELAHESVPDIKEAEGGLRDATVLNALVAMDVPGPGTVFMSQSLKYLAPTYLGDVLTAEVEVLELKADKPVCRLRAIIRNQDGTTVLEGDCWTYTLRPARA